MSDLQGFLNMKLVDIVMDQQQRLRSIGEQLNDTKEQLHRAQQENARLGWIANPDRMGGQ